VLVVEWDGSQLLHGKDAKTGCSLAKRDGFGLPVSVIQVTDSPQTLQYASSDYYLESGKKVVFFSGSCRVGGSRVLLL
jgi:hypothetical protein